MAKIDLSVKINNRELTDKEQEFIKVWLKFLELMLERGIDEELLMNIQIVAIQLGNLKILKSFEEILKYLQKKGGYADGT